MSVWFGYRIPALILLAGILIVGIGVQISVTRLQEATMGADYRACLVAKGIFEAGDADDANEVARIADECWAIVYDPSLLPQE